MCVCVCGDIGVKDVLNEDMPVLEVFKPRQPQQSDISIELQIPAGLTEVGWNQSNPSHALSLYLSQTHTHTLDLSLTHTWPLSLSLTHTHTHTHSQSVELNPSSLWEDEDSYQFYAGVTDIRPFVPAILFEGKKRGTSESSDSTAAASGGAEGAKTEGEGQQQQQQEEEGGSVLLECIIIVCLPQMYHGFYTG